MVWAPKLGFGKKPAYNHHFLVIRYHLINCEDLPTTAFKLRCFIILKYIIFKLSITSFRLVYLELYLLDVQYYIS